jgi:hypothetical protein
MPTWFWLNIPLMAVAFTLMVGLPVRLVLRDRSAGAPASIPAPAPARELIYS